MSEDIDTTQAATEEALEPLPGSIVAQYIRCGKPHCRCLAGERHGPYHYRIWREGEHVHKVYVKNDQLARVKAQCELHQAVHDGLKQAAAERAALAQKIRAEWRKTNALLRRHQALRHDTDGRTV